MKVTIEEHEASSRTIQVSAPDRVLEGEDIEVTLTNTEVLGTGESIAVAFEVTANPTGFYDLANSDSSPITMTDASTTETFTIKTIDSPTLNTNGNIDIEVKRGDQYEPASVDAEQVTIVAKETLPTMSITRTSPIAIDEGEDAIFTVSASGVTLTQPLDVSYTVDEGSSDFIDQSITIPPTVSVSTTDAGQITIKTKADATDETDGTITVTLTKSSDARYLLGANTADKTATITIKDNDVAGVSGITISGTSPVTEGDSAQFTLSANNPALTGDETISVRVQITETGDFLATPANVSPRITNVIIDSSGPGLLTLATTPDAIDEVDGNVTARIISEDLTGGASATYTIGENPTAEIVLQDNDDPILPSINIVAANSPVDEADGAMAQFSITATTGTSGNTSPVMVDLLISQVGNFLENAPGTRSNISVTPGASGSEVSTPHSEPITNDLTNEPNGEIIAKIITKSEYAVGAMNVARVEVNDDEEVPELVIANISKAEGQSGTTVYDFKVGITRETAVELNVDYTIGKAGDTATLDDDYTVPKCHSQADIPSRLKYHNDEKYHD